MKHQNRLLILLFSLPFLFSACTKNLTRVVEDADAQGLAVFSNSQNNIMTCYVGGKPWRTKARFIGLFGVTGYELTAVKQTTNTVSDTLHLSWSGYFSSDKTKDGTIALAIPVPKTFSYQSFSKLQGQRINLDTSNGYFTLHLVNDNTKYGKGKGNIYFHIAQLDSVGPSRYKGTLSGLFNAMFNILKIENGRFDHALASDENAYFY